MEQKWNDIESILKDIGTAHAMVEEQRAAHMISMLMPKLRKRPHMTIWRTKSVMPHSSSAVGPVALEPLAGIAR